MIEFQEASKRYGDDVAAVAALHPLDLTIERGEVFGIIGQSGAGKSTMLRLINGLERASAGRVLVDGRDIASLDGAALRAQRRRSGMIFQHFNLLSSRTVAQNIEFPLRLDGAMGTTERQQRVAALLERVGLGAHAHKYPAQLSGGQKQRVGIARALTTSPDLLLCDEATSALDPQTTASVLDLLAQLHRELSFTIVLITHEMDVIRRICDRVAVLEAGHLVESGRVADVFLDPQHDTTRRFLRESGLAAIEVDAATLATIPGRIAHLRFRGAATHQPLLSAIARRTGVEIGVLAGRVDRLRDQPFGELTVSLREGDVDAALAQLVAADVQVRVLREASP